EVVQIIPIENIKTLIQKEFPINDIESLVEDELELMREIETDYRISESFKKRIQDLIQKLGPVSLKQKNASGLPKLRTYQENAILAWKNNGYKGMLAMATGTGKTFTALAAIWELLRNKERLFIIISCPFIHLAEQWCEEALKFGL